MERRILKPKKIIHEEEEHEVEKKNLSPESKKNKFFMLASLGLVFLALNTLFFFIFKNNIDTLEPERQFIPVIFSDKNVFFEVKGLNKEKIAQTILNEVNGTLVKNGGVEGIYLTEDKKVIGLRRFIALIKGNFIPSNNNFINGNFLLGVVKNEGGPASAKASANFFILLKMRSLIDFFDNMRAWENKMFYDLHGFFWVDISPETKYLLTANFEDGIVENKNARILYDKDNKIVMMYIFADDTSVVITNTENAAREIMLRLASSQIKR